MSLKNNFFYVVQNDLILKRTWIFSLWKTVGMFVTMKKAFALESKRL